MQLQLPCYTSPSPPKLPCYTSPSPLKLPCYLPTIPKTALPTSPSPLKLPCYTSPSPLKLPCYTSPSPLKLPCYTSPSPPKLPCYTSPSPLKLPCYTSPSPPKLPCYTSPSPLKLPCYTSPSPLKLPCYTSPSPLKLPCYTSPSPLKLPCCPSSEVGLNSAPDEKLHHCLSGPADIASHSSVATGSSVFHLSREGAGGMQDASPPPRSACTTHPAPVFPTPDTTLMRVEETQNCSTAERQEAELQHNRKTACSSFQPCGSWGRGIFANSFSQHTSPCAFQLLVCSTVAMARISMETCLYALSQLSCTLTGINDTPQPRPQPCPHQIPAQLLC
ncbi:hypothetical protein JZ751_017238 [Albula glossodonta]|uniref:Uncharacterized protein n=1 Tax=Albula glossodonta TaxID=121402 RepID=A0A8T2MX43_9TELE|nr:hypothetical protein JZ751_017238 [Albula glossodonta]